MAEKRPLLSSGEETVTRADGDSDFVAAIAVEVNNEDHEEEEGEDDEENKGFTASGHHIDETHSPTSNCETMVHLLKGNVGTGILAMPDALKNSGLYTGTALLPIIGAICIHCMHILAGCSNELKGRVNNPSLDYADVAESAFKTGPQSLRFLATFVRRLVNVFLCITQIGFCCVYVVFISANLKQVFDCQFPNAKMDIHGYMLLLLVPLLLISLVRSLKVLAPFSMASNFFIGLGLSVTFHFILSDMPPSYDRREFTSFAQLPLFLGTSIYAFEGIGVVLPLERRMKTPAAFRGWNGVLNTAMIIVTCGYIGVGFFGYLKYGDAVHGSITLNLPPHDNLAQMVKVLMALAIYFTYTLMLHVPVEIMWPHLRNNFHSPRSRLIGEYVFRMFLVLLTFVLAAAIPNIGLFISLVGAMSSSTLAIIFPPIIQMVTYYGQGLTKVTAIKCCCILAFGICAFITGSYASIQAIIAYFDGSDEPQPEFVC